MARTLLFWCMYKRPFNRGGAQCLGTTARLAVLALGGTLSMASAVQAQTAKEGDKVLPEVRVNAQVKGQALDEAQRAFSVTEFRRDEIREQPRQEVESLWNLVPGMHVNHYQLSGVANALVLRGFGGGGHGGDVAATLDGIPLNEAMSHADGYFDLNVVVPLELDKVNVYRGPVSVLQGNYNRAGLLELRTRRSGSYTEFDVSAGSHGMFDAQAALGRGLEGAISSTWRPSIRAVTERGPPRAMSAAPSAAPGSTMCMKSSISRCPAAGTRRVATRPAI